MLRKYHCEKDRDLASDTLFCGLCADSRGVQAQGPEAEHNERHV